MKVTQIFDVLNMALKCRKDNNILNPLFVGDSGLGKSAVVRQWVDHVRSNINPNFGFIDLRIAYLEAPDIKGFFETVVDKNGKKRTTFCLPSFWPTEGEGLLLLEEPNRGATSVMNCLMQLLAEGQVGEDYIFPKGWIIASAINPETQSFDVNSMDAALKNRFVEYKIDYDHLTFMNYMVKNKWNTDIINFIKAGLWIYKESDTIIENGKYISSRSWEQLNSVITSNKEMGSELFMISCISILGKDVGIEFYKYVKEECPVLYKDVIKDLEGSIKKLKEQSDPNNYKGELIERTVESIEANYSCLAEDKMDPEKHKEMVSEEMMVAVARAIPSDQAVSLITKCGYKSIKNGKANATKYFSDLISKYPELKKILKVNFATSNVLKGNK